MEKGTCKQGVFVKNVISGIEGFVAGRLIWMYGCEKMIILPRKPDNSSLIPNHQPRYIWSEEYLELIDEKSPYEQEFSPVNTEKWFGKKCRDKVTGTEGICVACMSCLFSADQYILQWAKKNGKTEEEWFDEGRLELISDGVNPDDITSPRPGGSDIILPKPPLPAFVY